MCTSMPDDGSQVDPWDEPPPVEAPIRDWDFETAIPDEWRWGEEGVRAFLLATGWGPK